MSGIDPTHEHLDPTSEITLESIKKRAVKGVVVLTGRTFLLQVLSFGAWFLLSIFLDEAQIGVFFIVSAVVNFLRYFSDVGLAAALIQKKEKVTDIDLKTTFTIQQVLVITLILILYLVSPYLKNYYNLSSEGVFLLYALGISFFLSSLKTIPSILLERELAFGKFVIPEVLENLVYNFTAVILAWLNFGISSFTWAVIIRGIVGVVAIYVLRPWKPGIALSKKSLKKLLTFGVPYQLNTFLATIKDDGLTAFLGGVIGTTGIGYLGWAQKWSQTPLRLFMDNVLKVTFPAFSRMQDDKKHLERSVTRSIFFVCFLVFPAVVGFILIAPILVDIIPRYEKWKPALIPLYLVSINTLFAASTTQLTNLLNAIGKIKTTFKLMIMWTVLTWVTIPFLATKYGVNGVAAGYAIVGTSSIVAILIARRYVRFSIREGIGKPLLATLTMGTLVYLVRPYFSVSFTSLVFLAFFGGIIYLAVSYYLVGHSLYLDARRGVTSFLSKK